MMSACGGGNNPVTGDIHDDSIENHVLGVNTPGVSLDCYDISSDWDITVSSGGSHVVTYEPSADMSDSCYEAICSSGSWVIDGVNVGTRLVTYDRSIEWVAPLNECEVQFLFNSSESSSGNDQLGIVVDVSDDWYQAQRPPVAYEREAIVQNPITGETAMVASGELLVRMDRGAGLADVLSLSTSGTYKIIERVSESQPVYRIRLDNPEELASVWLDLESDPSVGTVEPNYLAYPTFIPEDPDYGKKHEFPNIDAPLAWDITLGSADVWVAVIDTGVDRNHPEFTGSIVSGADFITGGDGLGGETPGDGVDNNQDGIVDQNVGHGTHCAGIIAAHMNNGEGACGIASGTKILPLRIFPTNGDTGATFSSIIQAVEYATEIDEIRVLSMSIATSYESSLLQSAINEAWNAGKVIVAAAANSNTDIKYYPAAHNHVVAVAAINKSGTKASFSNFGDWVDISAYGTGIYSTYFDDTYAYMSGTSMACPLVSGCFALLFAADPTLSNELAVDVLTTFTSDVYTDNPDYIGELGSGMVNPYLALNGLTHSQPGDLDDADSDGSQSDIGLEPGPSTQG